MFKLNQEQWRIILARLETLEMELQSLQRGLGLQDASVRSQETGFSGPTTTLMQSFASFNKASSDIAVGRLQTVQASISDLSAQLAELASNAPTRASEEKVSDTTRKMLAQIVEQQGEAVQLRIAEVTQKVAGVEALVTAPQASNSLNDIEEALKQIHVGLEQTTSKIEEMPVQLKGVLGAINQHQSNEANALLNAILGQMQAGSNAASSQIGSLPEHMGVLVEGVKQHQSNEANALLNAILGQLQAGSNAAANQMGALPEQMSSLVEGVKQHQSNEANALLNAILGQLQAGPSLAAVPIGVTSEQISGQLEGVKQHQSNEANGLLNAILGQVQSSSNSLGSSLGASTQVIISWLERIHQSQQSELVRNNLQWRGMVALQKPRQEFAKLPSILPRPVDFDSQLADLKKLAPKNYNAWAKAFENAIKHYTEWASDSLSTQTHPHGHFYEQFVLAHATGRILDIGVGVLPIPSYLESYPIELIHGLDPLPPLNDHPFPFSRSVSEFIPWPDASMDTVVLGGSLDHIYLPDLAFREIARVLKPKGKAIIITGLEASDSGYNPYGPSRPACDEFHLFHPSLNDILAWTKNDFELIEHLEPIPNNGFLAFQRR
jgi:SAM-dependent methyltransferase